jgi:hypothetical protein
MKQELTEEDKRRMFEEAMDAWEEEKKKQIEKDNKVLESIKKGISKEIFEIIEQEIYQSDHAFNFRIITEPEGELDRTIDGIKVYVDQYSVGDSGDSWAGTVCVGLPTGKYLIWDFEM